VLYEFFQANRQSLGYHQLDVAVHLVLALDDIATHWMECSKSTSPIWYLSHVSNDNDYLLVQLFLNNDDMLNRRDAVLLPLFLAEKRCLDKSVHIVGTYFLFVSPVVGLQLHKRTLVHMCQHREGQEPRKEYI